MKSVENIENENNGVINGESINKWRRNGMKENNQWRRRNQQ
jgi:hypothetical protein